MAFFRTGGGTDTSDANATAGDILLNKTAYVDDNKITGSMPNNGDVSHTIGAGEVYNVPAGYTSGGVITAIAAGATITVTYTSDFYNKTMTCTKGQTTYTQTTTSSGSTTFSVAEGGTWTITCNGVSRQVDVVLEYTTQMAITATVDVYSAASDTVSFTDITGAKTVTTDANGYGSVSISFIPNSTITFTSSIAKNPSNLSQAYSKTITMTDSITTIKVTPTNTIYWYGYNYDRFNALSTGWGTYLRGLYSNITNTTKNTNYLTIFNSSGGFAPASSEDSFNINGTIKIISQGVGYVERYGYYQIYSYPTQSFTPSAHDYYYEHTSGLRLATCNYTAGDYVYLSPPSLGCSANIYACFVE